MNDRNIYQHLLHWKSKYNRKPLIIRGARQVGKTYSIKKFAENEFEDFISLNLDQAETFEKFSTIKSVDGFIQLAEALFSKKVTEKTLIFIDEIQNSGNLINLLRFFYEERPELFVITAGSLLEAKIKMEGFGMPVGRVEYLYMYPLDFMEYLKAMEDNLLVEQLENLQIGNSNGIHQLALQRFKEYMMVGGMPENVYSYKHHKSVNDLKGITNSLLTAFNEDVGKYAPSGDINTVTNLIRTIPHLTGLDVKYEEISDRIGKDTNKIKSSLQLLEDVMLLKMIYCSESINIPINYKSKRAKKISYLDISFINLINNIYEEYLIDTKIDNIFTGRSRELIVSQNIIAQGVLTPLDIYYWARKKEQGDAAIDFLLEYKSRMVGIEVKSGKEGSLKSLYSFADNTEESFLVRIYSGELRFDEISYSNKRYKVLNLPFYLITRLYDFLDKLM